MKIKVSKGDLKIARKTLVLVTFLSIALAGVEQPGIVLVEGIILTVMFLSLLV